MEGAPLSQRVIDGLADAAATYSDLVVKVALDPHDSDPYRAEAAVMRWLCWTMALPDAF
jgi:hypothetical protein